MLSRTLSRLVFPILLTFTLINGYAQQKEYKIANNPIFRDLATSNSNYIRLFPNNPETTKLLPITEYPYSTFPQNIIYNKGHIYVFLISSGVLYQSNKLDAKDDYLYFSRLDSTSLIKYNINCYSFIYKDSVFNIGGYGFWRWNGHLRAYNNKFREWDIIPLNKELPIENDDRIPNIWYSPKMNKLTSLYYINGNDGIENVNGSNNNTQIIDSVIELNLNSKKWLTKGSLNPDLKKILNKSNKIVDLDSGILINHEGEIAYLNFIDNSVRKADNTNYKYFFNTKIGSYPIIWYRNNYIFFSKNFNENEVDSIKINLGDFKMTGNKIYIEGHYLKPNYDILLISLLMLSILIFYVSKKIRKKGISPKSNAAKDIRNLNEKELFTLMEKLLLSIIVKNQKELGKKTSVDEVNKLLGISNKSIDVQKRKRSDTISSINEKYALITNNQEFKLINRVRTEFDKRMYEFFILEEDITVIENYIY